MRRDGARFWARLLVKSITPGGLAGETVWMVEDITDRKATEAELARAREELEQRVRAAHYELAWTNERLVAEAERDNSNRNEVAIRILAKRYRVAFVPGGRKADPSSSTYEMSPSPARSASDGCASSFRRAMSCTCSTRTLRIRASTRTSGISGSAAWSAFLPRSFSVAQSGAHEER